MPGSETGSAKSFAFAIRSLLESSVPSAASVPLYGVKSFSSRAFAARKQLAEFFHGCGSHASQLGVGVSVLRARHSDQCRGDPRSRPRELQGALRIVLQAEGFRNESGQVARDLTLQERRARDYGDVEIAGGLHQGSLAFAQHLISLRECFRHPQVERKLHKAEVVHPAGNFLSDLRDLAKLHRIARARILAEAVPRGHSVEATR